MLILDSLHTKEHVAAQQALNSPLLARGSRIVVEDTNLGGRPVLGHFGPCGWEAVSEFLNSGEGASWNQDKAIETRFGPYTSAPDAWMVKA